ncbi:MAG: serine/threonine-protein kinase [Myxococcota bacterium]
MGPSKSRDRDLLFAVFALQLGHVRPEHLAQAVEAWSSSPRVSLAEHLARQANLRNGQCVVLWQMVDEAAEAHGPDGASALAELGIDRSAGAAETVEAVLEVAGAPVEQTLRRLGLADTWRRRRPRVESLEVTPEAAGRYVPLDGTDIELGRGGLGRVYVRWDRHLAREVAMKELLAPDRRLDDNETFTREARITGQLEHPGIVPVHELGRRRDGRLYYTMKRVRGQTLEDALSGATTLADRLKLLSAFLAVSQALAYAHSRSVLHRDVKPANVLLGAFGETLLVDWGLAKTKGEDDGDALPGSAIGTPQYMSPEQAKGDLEAIDERSDVWSLGAMLFELLTGEAPYRGRGPSEVIEQVRRGSPPKVRSRAPEVPPDLAAIADRALAYAPKDRYPSAAEMAHDVEAYLAGKQVGSYAYGSAELLRRFFQRNRAASIAAGLLLLSLVAGSIAVSFAYQREGVARAAAERAQEEAETARGAAEAREEDARGFLARAYLERGERLNEELRHGRAAIYAASALTLHPRARKASDLPVRAKSVLHRAQIRRRLRHECRYPTPHAQPWNEDGSELISYVSGTTTATVWSTEGCRAIRTHRVPKVSSRPSFDAVQVRSGALLVHGVNSSFVLREGRPARVEPVAGSHPGSLFLLEDEEALLSTRPSDRRARYERLRIGDGEVLGVSPPWRSGSGSHFALSPEDREIAYVASSFFQITRLDTLRPSKRVTLEVSDPSTPVMTRRQLVLGSFERVRAFGAEDFELRWSRSDLRGYTRPCADAEGTTLAVVSEDTQLLDPETGRTLERVPGKGSCYFAPSGARLLTQGDGYTDVWRVEKPPLREIAPPASDRQSVQVSADGRWLATAGGDVRAWVEVHDLREGARVWRRESSGEVPPDVAFSPDSGALAVLSGRHEVEILDLNPTPTARFRIELPLERANYNYRDIRFHPSGRILAWVVNGRERQVFRLDVEALRMVDPQPFALSSADQLAFGPSGVPLIVAGPDGVEILRPEPRGRERLPSEMKPFVITAVDVSERGWLAVAGTEGRTWMYRLSDPAETFILQAPHLGPLGTVRFSGDGGLLCVGDDTQLVVWDVSSRQERLRIEDTGVACAFTPDGESLISDLEGSGLYQYPLALDTLDLAPGVLLDRAEAADPLRLSDL